MRPTPSQEYLSLKNILDRRRTKPKSVISGPGKGWPHHPIEDKSSKRRQNIKSRAAKGRNILDALASVKNRHVSESKIFSSDISVRSVILVSCNLFNHLDWKFALEFLISSIMNASMFWS